MQLKRRTKSLILLIALLFIRSPHQLQATQSNAKKLVISTLALTFLGNRLMNLSDTKQSGSLFVTIHKLKNAPETLTKEEKQKLSQYVGEETVQLGKELPLLKDDKAFQSKQNTYQQLTSLQQQLALQHKTWPSQTIHRPHELLIPANGNCLYTSIILGYLLPVVNNPNGFKERLGSIIDTKKLPITHQQLASNYHDLHYLHSDKGFHPIIQSLLKQTGIKPGTWGGPKEIQRIAEKLKVDIQEYTPDPDNPKQLIKGDLTQPKNDIPECCINIIQDIPRK